MGLGRGRAGHHHHYQRELQAPTEELEAHRNETGTREANRPKLAHMILLTGCKLDNPDEDGESTIRSWNITVQNIGQWRSHRESRTGGDEGP